MLPSFARIANGRLGFLALLMLCLVGATNHWLVKDPDMSIFRFDSVSYLEIARHSPGLPGFIDVSAGYPELPDRAAAEIPYQHSQRFAYPYLLGYVAKLFSLPLEPLFAFVAALAFAICLTFMNRIWASILSGETSLLLLALFTMNPFIVRFYFAVPTYLGDIAFHLCLAVLCFGLIQNSPLIVLMALALGMLGRQTMLLALPAVWIWPWKSKNERVWIFLATALCLAIYAFTGRVAAAISPTNRNLEHLTGMISWIVGSGMEGHSREGETLLQSAGVLGRFFARALLAQLPLLALLVCLFKSFKFAYIFKDRELLAFLLMAAGVASQPFLAGPTLTGDTVVRLVALSSVPLLVLAAQLISRKRLGFSHVNVCIFLLFLSSFHHRYSLLSQLPGREYIFMVFQFLAAAYLAFSILTREKAFQHELS